MNEVYQKVIDKLDKEAEKEKNPAIRAIEGMLREVCKNDADACEKVLADGKTMKGAYDAMYEVAKKRKNGNCAVIAPDEAQSIILKYYGIGKDSGAESAKSQTPENVSTVTSLFDLI